MTHTIGVILTGFVAIEHIYILILEMFLWTKPKGLEVFRQTQERAEETRVLGANQGLYNGFLAAGLLWGLFFWHGAIALDIRSFFLSCVLVAGIYGGITVYPRVALVQGLPAALALIFLWL
ncbi:MAG: DUF1304 domain-containing protein [Candidatus Xenobia bacterium]